MAYFKVTKKQSGGGGGVSEYATGTFTTGSSMYAKVEVNCGFEPDYLVVDMEFGSGHTCATYFKGTNINPDTNRYYERSIWDLRPIEPAINEIQLGSEQGETGISDITSTGFKYRCMAANTQNKPCTYKAIKF